MEVWVEPLVEGIPLIEGRQRRERVVMKRRYYMCTGPGHEISQRREGKWITAQ
jgi:hypothetical protein